jgi:ferritin-like protein
VSSLCALSRRRFLALAGSTGLLTVAGLGRLPAGLALSDQADVLSRTVDMENQAIFAYGAMVKAGVLPPEPLARANSYLDDHAAHRDLLADAVRSLGEAAPSPKVDYPLNGPGGLPADLKSEKGIMDLAVFLEETLVESQYAAISGLTKSSLRQRLASVLGVEAQHVAILRNHMMLDPVPHPFVDQGL